MFNDNSIWIDKVLEDFPELQDLRQKGAITEKEFENAVDIIRSHRCNRCGACCKILVKVLPLDIKRLEKHGYSEREIIRDDCLRLNNGGCVFLRKNGSSYRCAVHDFRPRACRRFPFTVEYHGGGLIVGVSTKCRLHIKGK